MKEIYDWVPWFKELAEKIAEGGEQYLIERVKRVPWGGDDKEPSLLRNINPLSFFYTLASRSSSLESRRRIYPSIASAFAMSRELDPDLDDAFIFPTPPALTALFRGEPSLLWRLFREAVSGFGLVDPRDFESALRIQNVATRKLTQVLFLINPENFFPIDDHTKSLGFFDFDSVPNQISWEHYQQLIDRVKTGLPRCHLYEANLFAYLQSSGKLAVQADTYFQVSTNVYNDGDDYWADFESNNHVYTGGPGEEKKYPLDQPKFGDVILVRFGQWEGRGIGIIYENDHQGEFDEDHRLHVLWLNKTKATLSACTPIIGFSRAGNPTIEAFRQTREYASTFELLDRLENREETEEAPSPENRSVETKHPLNQILYGPPGTGKTWNTVYRALAIIEGKNLEEIEREAREKVKGRFEELKEQGQIAMATFHQNFAYEDFIEGIRPVLGGENNLAYEIRAGIFKRIVEVAKDRPDEKLVLIIDEINRGNIAKIFGELITLVEDARRIGGEDETRVTLPYSQDKFGVPDNLYIIGTMNTADRSIQLLDTALRRRFVFIEMMPNPEHEGICRDIDGIDCTEMLKTMNERIAVLLDREHQIGHTYLLGVDEIGALSKAFLNQIFPLLQEYFFDDWKKIREVLGHNAFVNERKVAGLDLADLADEDRVVYERLPDGDSAWEAPDQYRKIYAKDA